MIRVIIAGGKYSGSFKTLEEAETWANKHHANDGTNVEIIEEHLHDRDNKLKQLIEKRDQILCATDWLFMSDVKVDQKYRRMYLTYRQMLRDVPQKLKNNEVIQFEEFDHWLRRNHPEEFMDGGKNEQILHRFYYYVK